MAAPAAEYTKSGSQGFTNAGMDAAITDIVARERGEYDELTVRCGLCDWSFTGPNRDAADRAAEHRDALHAAEYEAARKRRRTMMSSVSERWPKDRVLERLKKWAAEHDGAAPTQKEWSGKSTDDHPNWGHVHALFGTWGRALELAGLRPKAAGGVQTGNGKGRVVVTDAEIVVWVRAFVTEHDCKPGKADWGVDGMLSQSGVKKRFGSMGALFEQAGVADAPQAKSGAPSNGRKDVNVAAHRIAAEATKSGEDDAAPEAPAEPVVEPNDGEEQQLFLASFDERLPLTDRVYTLAELAEELEYVQEQYDGWQTRMYDARQRFFAHPVIRTIHNEWGLDDECELHGTMKLLAEAQDASGDKALAVLVKMGWDATHAAKQLAEVDAALPFYIRAFKVVDEARLVR